MNAGVEVDLKALSMPERIKAISEDVKSGKDKYRNIDAHELAELLGIENSWDPEGDWSFIFYVWKEPLAEYMDRCGLYSGIFDCLKGIVKDERFAAIRKLGEQYDVGGCPDLGMLRKKEIRLIEEAVAFHEFEKVGHCVIARYSIKGPRRHLLQFEGFIEDDGSCIDLKTPYDERDGGFTDLTDCVTEEDLVQHWQCKDRY